MKQVRIRLHRHLTIARFVHDPPPFHPDIWLSFLWPWHFVYVFIILVIYVIEGAIHEHLPVFEKLPSRFRLVQYVRPHPVFSGKGATAGQYWISASPWSTSFLTNNYLVLMCLVLFELKKIPFFSINIEIFCLGLSVFCPPNNSGPWWNYWSIVPVEVCHQLRWDHLWRNSCPGSSAFLRNLSRPPVWVTSLLWCDLYIPR